MPLRSLAGVAAVAALAACSPKGEKVAFFSADDAKMNAATRQARETLPVFWSKVDGDDPAISNKLVKVGLPNTHDSLEHIWMTVDSHSGLAVRGRLANDPVDLPNLHYKDALTVDTSKITDWAYTKAGAQYGGFTLRAMLDKADPQERQELEATLAPTPLEPDAH